MMAAIGFRFSTEKRHTYTLRSALHGIFALQQIAAGESPAAFRFAQICSRSCASRSVFFNLRGFRDSWQPSPTQGRPNNPNSANHGSHPRRRANSHNGSCREAWLPCFAQGAQTMAAIPVAGQKENPGTAGAFFLLVDVFLY